MPRSEIERIGKKFLLPRFGDRMADSITRSEITSLVEDVTYRNPQQPTLREGHTVHQRLSAFYSWAMPKLALDIIEALPVIEGSNLLFAVPDNPTTVSIGFSKGHPRLLRLMAKEQDDKPVEHFVLHDLRRTAATGMQRLGVAMPVTEAVLNHISGSRGGIAGVYQRHDYFVEKRAALNLWAEELIRIGQWFSCQAIGFGLDLSHPEQELSARHAGGAADCERQKITDGPLSRAKAQTSHDSAQSNH